uniref:AMMECR1 domain-containing protein n=1 Tax=Pristionchus pacificus TaxID=54126 RepID=A0A2A6B5C6_PRIPA|eukprot:PDM61079.1 hypothetical protein PRIPAC_54885 [Pristionchus pacificus]
MTKTINRDMAAYCFETLSARLDGRRQPAAPATIPAGAKFPLFVTWKKGGAKHLRGCIGTFEELRLAEGLAEYALTAAMRDSRFEPISAAEMPQLHCGVSLLVQFEPAVNYLDWQVGVHGKTNGRGYESRPTMGNGIRIHFMDPVAGHRRSGVFLPEVASEQGWNHTETLDHLLRKAGYKNEITEQLRRSVEVTRFQSEKVGMSFKEWQAEYHNNDSESSFVDVEWIDIETSPLLMDESALAVANVIDHEETIEMVESPVDSSDFVIVKDTVSHLDESIETSQPPNDSFDFAIVEDTVSRIDESIETSQRPIDPSDSAIVEDTVSCLDESIETSQCPIDSSDSAIVESAVSRLDESIETSQPPIDSSDSAIVEDTVSCLIDRIEMMESECGTSKDTADVICTKAAGGERSGSVVSIDSDLEIVLVTRRVARGRGVQKWNTGKNGWMPEDALGWRRCGLIPFGNSEEIEMEGERENRPGGLRRDQWKFRLALPEDRSLPEEDGRQGEEEEEDGEDGRDPPEAIAVGLIGEKEEWIEGGRDLELPLAALRMVSREEKMVMPETDLVLPSVDDLSREQEEISIGRDLVLPLEIAVIMIIEEMEITITEKDLVLALEATITTIKEEMEIIIAETDLVLALEVTITTITEEVEMVIGIDLVLLVTIMTIKEEMEIIISETDLVLAQEVTRIMITEEIDTITETGLVLAREEMEEAEITIEKDPVLPSNIVIIMTREEIAMMMEIDLVPPYAIVPCRGEMIGGADLVRRMITPTPIRELPAPTKRQRRDRSISREWNPPPLRRKGFMNDNDTRSPSSSSRQRQKKRGRRRSSSPLEVVDDRRGGRRESNSSSQYIPPDPRSGRRDTSPVRPSYGWKTSSREAMETGGVGLSESRPIVIDDDEGRGGGRETRNSCNPILSAFSAIREMLPPNNQSQKESAGKAKAAKPAVDQSIVDQAPKGSKAKPLVNGCLLSFSLELYSNYEEIVDHFERLRAAVTVVRRPMSARPGACVLELPHEIATTILLSRSPIRFGQNTVPLKSPAVVELSMEREGMDATKLEAEIEKQFGPIVQVVVDGRTKKKGWVMFADESSAARALAVGSLTCESTEGSIRFETVDEKKNGEGMWQLKEDRTWISHRMRAQRCRCMAATSKSNERTKWNEPEMRKVIEDQIRDEGDVLLVGGPIVGDLCLADVKQYFKSRFGVIAYEVEKPTVDDPGTFDINVKVRENGGFKSHSVVELLTVDHIISGHSIALGLVSSIDIVTTPVDPKLQRMMVIEFQKQFGAVIGFLEKGREEGRGRYRIVFMHLHHAARAHETLSVLVDRPFLPGMEQVIIHEVDHLKTWKEQKAKD